MSAVDPAAISGHIETLVSKLEGLGDTETAHGARELVRLVMTLHGEGLSRVLDIVRTERGGPQAVLDRFVAEPLLASLLVLHDLHPQPLLLRVDAALAALRPHLSSGTQVAVASASDEGVHLVVQRQAGSREHVRDLRSALERAIHEAAPEVATIRIDGLEEPLLQIMGLARRSGSPHEVV